MAIGLGLVVAGLAVQDVSTSLFVFATGVVLIVFESVDLIAGLAGWSQRHK